MSRKKVEDQITHLLSLCGTESRRKVRDFLLTQVPFFLLPSLHITYSDGKQRFFRFHEGSYEEVKVPKEVVNKKDETKYQFVRNEIGATSCFWEGEWVFDLPFLPQKLIPFEGEEYFAVRRSREGKRSDSSLWVVKRGVGPAKEYSFECFTGYYGGILALERDLDDDKKCSLYEFGAPSVGETSLVIKRKFKLNLRGRGNSKYSLCVISRKYVIVSRDDQWSMFDLDKGSTVVCFFSLHTKTVLRMNDTSFVALRGTNTLVVYRLGKKGWRKVDEFSVIENGTSLIRVQVIPLTSEERSKALTLLKPIPLPTDLLNLSLDFL